VSRGRRSRSPLNHGKHRKRRPGTHKRAASPETVRWEAEHLIPECPPWLPADTYVKLADLRTTL
jgi:hypothetical protein